RGLDRVIGEITTRGYDARWMVLSAADVGAPHLRKRWWLLAHARGERRQQIARGASCDEAADAGRPENSDHKPQRDGEGSRAGHAADAPGIGRGEGWPESAGQQGRLDTIIGSAEVADTALFRRDAAQIEVARSDLGTSEKAGRNGQSPGGQSCF